MKQLKFVFLVALLASSLFVQQASSNTKSLAIGRVQAASFLEIAAGGTSKGGDVPVVTG